MFRLLINKDLEINMNLSSNAYGILGFGLATVGQGRYDNCTIVSTLLVGIDFGALVKEHEYKLLFAIHVRLSYYVQIIEFQVKFTGVTIVTLSLQKL